MHTRWGLVFVRRTLLLLVGGVEWSGGGVAEIGKHEAEERVARASVRNFAASADDDDFIQRLRISLDTKRVGCVALIFVWCWASQDLATSNGFARICEDTMRGKRRMLL